MCLKFFFLSIYLEKSSQNLYIEIYKQNGDFICMDLIKYAHQLDWFRNNTQKRYMGNGRFESQLQYQLYQLRNSMAALIPYKQILEWLGDDCVLPNPFHLVIHQSYRSTLYNLGTDSIVK